MPSPTRTRRVSCSPCPDACDESPPSSEPYVPHVVDLEPLPDGGTRVTITETGYTGEEARRQLQAGQEQVMDKMQALVAPA